MHMWHNKAVALSASDETCGVGGDQGNGEEKQTSQVRDRAKIRDRIGMHRER